MEIQKISGDSGLETRKNVLLNALYLEEFSSAFLAQLLGIKDRLNSKSFGNSGSSLSFNAKINLLIDIGALKAEDRKKFQMFMEVRNQFMHNIAASSFIACFSFMEGTDRALLKIYPQDVSLSDEKKLEAAFEALTTEVTALTAGIIQTIKKRLRRDAEREMAEIAFEAMNKAMSETSNVLDEYFKREIEKEEPFNIKRLQGMGGQVSKIFYALSKKYLRELIDTKNSVKEADTK